MRIEHIALWTNDLEKLKTFYVKYFNATAGDLYFNQTKKFKSYFLSFAEGARLELIQMPGMKKSQPDHLHHQIDIAHLAFSVGSRDQVNYLTEELRRDGFTIAGEPRTTGDGYYESVVLDPDENKIK
jgi:lactoylglutathione lyase